MLIYCTSSIVLIASVCCRSVSAPKCKSGWEELGGECFRFSSGKLSWVAAQQECETEGATLAIVKTDEVHSFIKGETVFYVLCLY